jgi:hypothetical protein
MAVMEATRCRGDPVPLPESLRDMDIAHHRALDGQHGRVSVVT